MLLKSRKSFGLKLKRRFKLLFIIFINRFLFWINWNLIYCKLCWIIKSTRTAYLQVFIFERFISCIQSVQLSLPASPDRADRHKWPPWSSECPWARTKEWHSYLKHWRRRWRIPGWCRTCSRARRLRTCECDRWLECRRRAAVEPEPAHLDFPTERFDGRDISRFGIVQPSPPSARDSWGSAKMEIIIGSALGQVFLSVGSTSSNSPLTTWTSLARLFK